MHEKVKAALANLPQKPGVYLMYDINHKIIYVGKAVNLKRRVKSYFVKPASSPKVSQLVTKICDLETIVTSSESEALILECNLIKKYLPRYNVMLKDDKAYPYLKITNEPFSRLIIARRIINDGAKYFGPYTDTSAMKELLELITARFQLRTCTNLTRQTRPCLQFHLHRCLGPCAKLISLEAYQNEVSAVKELLEGKTKNLTYKLQQELKGAITNYAFEKASRLRDQLAAIPRILQLQQALILDKRPMDIIGLALDAAKTQWACQIFLMREGKLIGRERYLIACQGESEAEMSAAILKQHYLNRALPREIVLNELPETEELNAISKLLSKRAGHQVKLTRPSRGTKLKLLNLANQNAMKWLSEQPLALNETATNKLAAALKLNGKKLRRIECFDISHTQGTETVASMVVFIDARPSKRDYRRYKIRSTEGKPNDFEAMREVLFRRYKDAEKLKNLPDLIIVDGGKGQLSIAIQVLSDLDLIKKVPVIGLAKQEEEVFRPGVKESLKLAKSDAALHLIQQLRDEAHRFAITFHRKLRAKRNLTSSLDMVPGIGPKRKAMLFQIFGSLEKIKQAPVSQLATLPNMNKALAKKLHEALADF